MTNPKKGTAQSGQALVEAIEREYPFTDRVMTRGDLRVWEELQKQMPKTPKEVQDALALSIKDHGIAQRLCVLPDGRIFDGATRYTLSADHPLYKSELPVRVYDIPEELAQDMAYALNFDRRPITEEMRDKRLRQTLKRFPGWTDRRIAVRVGVSPTTVGKVRKELEAAGTITTPDVQEGRGGRTAQASTKPKRKAAATKASAKRTAKTARKTRPEAPKVANLIPAPVIFRTLLGNRPQEGVMELAKSGKLTTEMLPKKMEPKHWDALESWHVFLAALVTLDPRNGSK